ncbi:HTH CENPB-type domain-containing protein [Mycena chlorophos]|uniref:HTH CENPB-type domain-containing protein n=1 Tax=Mycena chlorophos TaxID=658473 RepID=A0A8H6S2Q0_MYCCL|nr:HTH CENPB-type domain-containing protein [Mycena chlorophos]
MPRRAHNWHRACLRKSRPPLGPSAARSPAASVLHSNTSPHAPRRPITTISWPSPPPTYHQPPLTPASSTSSFSPYRASFFPEHSRSTSLSTNPRSASPALSTVSALTSISSHSLPAASVLSPIERPKKQRLFNTQRREICEYHISHPNARQEDIARAFGVERSTVSKILKNKQKWLNIDVNETLKIAKHRPSKFPEIEEDMPDLIAFDNDATLDELEHVGILSAPTNGRPPNIDDATDHPSWLSNPVEPAPTPSAPPPVHPPMPIRSPHIETPTDGPGWLSQPVDSQPLTTQQPLGSAWPEPHHQQPPVQRTMSDPGPHFSPTVEMNDAGSVFSVPMYEQRQSQPSAQTSLAEAEHALGTVMNFLDTAGQGMVQLQPHERAVLDQLKFTLFQAGSAANGNGIRYDDRQTNPYEQGPAHP